MLIPDWIRVSCPIALLFACRMLGLFLLIPVFTLFAQSFTDETPQLIGLALGAYGLSQALMQIPFGILSDYFGRKPMIMVGLGLLFAGSLVGAWTHSIHGMILARILQGSGAIGSVLLALLSDVTPTEHRAKAMAMVGMSIGVSFSLAMILGPVLSSQFGLSSLFYLTASLAILGLAILYVWTPQTTIKVAESSSFHVRLIWNCLRHPELRKLNMGILLQHALLTSLFYVLPLQLQTYIQQGYLSVSWQFYLPIVFFSFVLMAPIVALSEKNKGIPRVLKLSVALMTLSQALLMFYAAHWSMLIALIFLYFVAFNLGEAFLPSQVSKHAPSAQRGTAMGVYSTNQFFGIFLGGFLAGLFYTHWGQTGVFALNTLMSLIWYIIV